MNHASTPPVGNRSGTETESEVVEGDQAESLLTALEDEDCRAILNATGAEALSASELSEACNMPLSTTYRKVDTLTEAGLLEEQIRISRSGKHTSEYALCVEDVQLSFGGEDGIELEITREAERSMQSLVASAD